MKQPPLIVLALALVSVLGFSVTAAAQDGAAQRPNIVLILTDDQGYGDLHRHGHPLLKTPHTDRLHDESVRFERFYVSPSCSPTRAALLSGMHEFRSGVTHTTVPRQNLHRDTVTFPQLLQDGGYRTAWIGKWHLGHGKGYEPSSRGFGWTSTNAKGPRGFFDPTMIRNGKRQQAQGFREDVYFDEAMDFIDESGDDPFFCYLATYSPHTPLNAPEEFIAPYRGKVSDDQAKYLGMVANIDHNVGRLLTFLEERELDEDTIVIFMNDNGVTVGLDVFNADMRGCKCTIWEGGSRAMSFWRWPGKWKPHAVDQLTAHLDVLPTLCDLAGVAVPDELQQKLDGFNLRPLLESEGDEAAWDHGDRMLFEHVGRWPSGLAASHKYAMAGVRQGDHLLLRSRPCGDAACESFLSQCTTLRLVQKGMRKTTYTQDNAQYHWGVSAAEGWSLFDVAADPRCENDLAAGQPELVERLGGAYEQWWDGLFATMIAKGGDAGTPIDWPRKAKDQGKGQGKPSGKTSGRASGKAPGKAGH